MCNQLNSHLQLVIAMYAYNFFTLDIFPYEVTYNMWLNVEATIGRGQHA
jgi:hypothetical protein